MPMTKRPESEYPYPSRNGQTHCDECWQLPRHHNCAVAKIDRLETHVTEALKLLESIMRGAPAFPTVPKEKLRAIRNALESA